MLWPAARSTWSCWTYKVKTTEVCNPNGAQAAPGLPKAPATSSCSARAGSTPSPMSKDLSSSGSLFIQAVFQVTKFNFDQSCVGSTYALPSSSPTVGYTTPNNAANPNFVSACGCYGTHNQTYYSGLFAGTRTEQFMPDTTRIGIYRYANNLLNQQGQIISNVLYLYSPQINLLRLPLVFA
jgi:hypothetical protein